jgi:hypothetical protein
LKGQEHRLEQGAALIAAFQLFWSDIQPTHLGTTEKAKSTAAQLVSAIEIR